MARDAILLFLKVSLVFTLFFAGTELLGLLTGSQATWRSAAKAALTTGLLLGPGLAAVVTVAAVIAFDESEWRQSPGSWFGMRQWTEVELPFALLESLELADQALRSQRDVSSVKVDGDRYRVTARIGRAWPNATLVGVTFSQIGAPEAATTRAKIEGWRVNAKRDVETVARALNQAVNQRLKAEREAADNARLQAQVHQARLGLLQAQVEPHFLYNTLASLQLLIRDDPAAAEKMTGDLIRYLRLSVPEFRGEGFTLGREMELVRAYLDIMKIRLRDRLQVDIRVDEAAAAHPFAPLLVHTLVENAIKHGIEPLPQGGRISIEARCLAGGGLRIAVCDTGQGLRAGLEGSGMGLANLRERLALLYGGHARFTLAPREPSGVDCVLEIPASVARAA